MNYLSDISNNHHFRWSRPIGLTLLITLLGMCLAVVVLVLATSNVASERSNDMKPTSSSQQSTTHVQVDSSSTSATTPTPTAQDPTAKLSMSTGEDSSKNNVQVTINGESVPVSEQGSVHRTMKSADGQTTVDVSSSSNGDASNSSYSSLDLNVSSNSSSFSSNSSVTIGGTTENN